MTLFVKPDSNGDRFPEWAAQAFYDHLLANAPFDAWYFDNNFWRPRSNADWNGDGTNDDKNDATVQKWYRQGIRAHYDRAAVIAPNLFRIVNADSDLSGDVKPANIAHFDEYKDAVHGAYLEHVMGASYSAENQGFAYALGWYQKVFDNLLEPKFVILNVKGASDDYQLLRYALAMTLLDDGYFSYDPGDYNTLPWFDEYDLAGTAGTHWLGAPIDPPQSSAWQNGVYRRRFEHGMAIVNPKGNGAQTVTVESGYAHFKGTQAPTVNDGQAVTTVKLSDRDGVLLVKQ